MSKFNTFLLREKFIIHDSSKQAEGPVVALSNRIVLELPDEKGNVEDVLVVRAHNMHSCARLMGRIIQAHDSGGSLLTRTSPFDWEAMWDTVVSDFEKAHNPALWATVYNLGRPVFKKGDNHYFLDIIEKCQASNRGEYEKSIKMAEDAFRTMGRVVKIDYDGNVALTLNLEAKQARVGVIVRNPTKTSTFNFSVAPKADKPLNYPQCIGAASAFLEGIQMAFLVGMNEEKIRLGKIERHSKEEKQTKEARQRLGKLEAEISTLEGTFDVRYRPERPDFQEVLSDAEKLAKSVLGKPGK
jgi:hypothetical protein